MDGAVSIRAAVRLDCILIHVYVDRVRGAAAPDKRTAGYRPNRTPATDRQHECNVIADLQRGSTPDHGSASRDVRVGRSIRIWLGVRLVRAERHDKPFHLDSRREMLPPA